jgi:hypothetical protein
MGEHWEHRERRRLNLAPQSVDRGGQTLAGRGLELSEQRREIPDDVPLGHRNSQIDA